MNIQIRRGVFETNSSSTHSITICSEDMFDKWQRGEVAFQNSWREEEQWIPIKEAEAMIHRTMVDNDYLPEEEYLDYRTEIMRDMGIYLTLEDYWDAYDYLEGYTKKYTTPGGEKIIAFGVYGHD